MSDVAAVELWLVDLDRTGPLLSGVEAEESRLTPADIERAQLLAHPVARAERMAAYTALRVLLERSAGPGVRGMPLRRGLGGKPRLESHGLDFSLAHTEAYALIGMAEAGPIGVDLERARETRFSERRRGELQAIAAGLSPASIDTEADHGLLRAWVVIEAVAKARGHGVLGLLAEIGLRQGPAHRTAPARVTAAARRHLAANGLCVHCLDAPPGLLAAVALRQACPAPLLRAFPTDRRGIDVLLAGATASHFAPAAG
jgi:4'-phosphopantetheinyl transferase